MAPPPLPGKIPEWVQRALRHPVAAAAAMTLGIRFGQEIYKLRIGELTPEEFEKRTGQHLGALGGTAVGLILGSAAGKALPGFGTVVGSFMGGMLGHMGGEHLGRAGAGRLGQAVAPKGETSEEASPIDASEDESEDALLSVCPIRRDL